MRIHWRDLDPRTCEDLIAVLLSRLHPDAVRIDGSGGDGGRDVQFGPDGRSIYEIKSFSNRLGSVQKRQIRKSLVTASARKPDSWTLVLPLDMSPAEERWFDGLRAEYPFNLCWRGRTWLESELAQRPEIQRYYVEGASDEVIRILAELKAEEALVREVPDVLARVRALHGRLNEIDPHYSYSFVTGESSADDKPSKAVLSATFGDIRIDTYERYVGATRDRPITLEVKVSFTSSDRELETQFRQAIEYGVPVVIPPDRVREIRIDAPAGLGGDFGPGEVELELGPAIPRGASTLQLHAQILDGRVVLASLPLDARITSVGRSGFVIYMEDATRWVSAQFTTDAKTKKCHGQLKFNPTEVLPSAALPAVRFLAEFERGRTLEMRLDGAEQPMIGGAIGDRVIGDGVSKLVEALDVIQRFTGIYFPVTLADFEDDDIQNVLEAAALMVEKEVEHKWDELTLSVTVGDEEANEWLLSTEVRQYRMEADFTLNHAGHAVPLGRIRTELASARIQNGAAIAQALSKGVTELEVILVPGEIDTIRRTRIGDARSQSSVSAQSS